MRPLKRATAMLAVAAVTLGTATIASAAVIKPAQANQAEVQGISGVRVDVTDANFSQVVAESNNRPVIFMKTGPNCGGCKAFLPKITEVANEMNGKFLFAYLDYTVAPSAADTITASNPRGVPAVVGYNNGQAVPGSYKLGALSTVDATRKYAQDLINKHSGGNNPPRPPRTTPAPVPPPTTPAPVPPPTTPAPVPPPVEEKDNILHVTDENIESVLQKSFEKPIVLDFYTEMCLGCEDIKPVLKDQLDAANGAWTLGLVNGKDESKVWERYNKPWFPTLIVIKDGKEVDRRTGFVKGKDEQAVIDFLKKNTGDNNNPPTDPGKPGSTEPIEVTPGNHDEFVAMSKDKPVILDFYTEMCLGCEQVKKVLKKRLKDDKGSWVLGMADGGKYPELPKKYDDKTMYFPTMFAIQGGEVVGRYDGYDENDPEIVKEFDEWLTKYTKMDAEPGDPGDDKPKPPPGDDKPVEGMFPVTSDNYDEVIKGSFNKTLILDFYTDNCLGCDLLKPVLKEQLKKDKASWNLGTVHGKKEKEIWEKNGKPWFPTLIAIRNGEEVSRRSGYAGDKDKEAVLKWIAEATNGGNPEGEKFVIDLDKNGSMDEAKEISYRHPVMIRVSLDDVFGKDGRDYKVLAPMAREDGGKWTLVDIPYNHPYAAEVRKHSDGAAIYPTVVTMWMGKLFHDPLLGMQTPDQYREYINMALSHKYPTD